MRIENAPAPEIEGHVPALDGVRGLAILVVMVGHLTLGWNPNYGFEYAIQAVIQTGWWGVDLFFVLSGFLITGILLDTKGSSHYFRNFYVRRVLRIFPLYYGFLFAFFILAPLLHPPAPGGPFDTWRQSQGWFWTYMSNNQLLFPHWPRPYPLTHFWTLAVEEQFYLFWPAIVLITSRKGLIRVCLACLAGSFLFRMWIHWAGWDPGIGYRVTPARFDTLAVGAMLAVLVRDPEWWPRLRAYIRFVIPASILGVTALSIPTRSMAQSGVEMQSVGYPLLAFLSVGLIVIAIDPLRRQTRASRFFQTAPMRVLGKYSYALYVFHLPLALVLERLGLSVQTFPRAAGSEIPGAVAFMLIAMAITLLISLLSWNLYEKHFLKLKRFFPRREDDITNMSQAPKSSDFGPSAALSGPHSVGRKAL
ncbi:MAG TPA: acyltransferase [Gemmatimonadaceae bacterium]|nr:acyltransferase [Gemmatimonadaceae bacterium]